MTLFAELSFDLQRAFNAEVWGIAVTGMVIVFAALTFISLFLASLPKILTVVNEKFPVSEGHAHNQVAPSGGAKSTVDEEEALAAAIGFALHTEVQEGSRQL